ncbi:MAG: hypothetical protein ACM3X1_02660 [Ignavibacteriales bacterium]
MRQIKECDCSPGTTSLRSVKINIIGSRIELECTKCNGVVDWWEEPAHNRKIMPFKRMWSDEERSAMR